MQEIGRGGGDNKKAKAILYYNNTDLAQPVVTDEVKEFCRSNVCRRQFLLSYFGEATENLVLTCSCCDICQAQCECKICKNLH